MAKLLCVIFLMLSITAWSQGQAIKRNSAEELMESQMVERMAVIEQLHGIEFDDDWKPIVNFGFPEELTIAERRSWNACYLPETQSFLFAPSYRYEKETSLLDHELGHALMDQVSRRSGNGPWPNYECVIYMSLKEKISVKIMSEGVGTYFEYEGEPPYKDDDEYGYNWLPDSPDDIAWDNIQYKYMGGRWLVAPIIKQYGERGIIYLITHPIEFHYDKVRTGAKAYREKALKELAAQQANTPSKLGVF